jgi:cell division septal protein FtsQ
LKGNGRIERRGSLGWLLLVVRLTLAVAGLAGACVFTWYAAKAVREGGYFQLAQIRYEGVRRFDTAAFDRLFRLSFGRDLPALDLHHIRALVESDRWVKTATVRRRYPNTLQIYVTEREAVAVAEVDGELFVVDGEGVLLERFGPEYQHLDRPIVKGLISGAMDGAPEENARRVAVYLRALDELSGPGPDYTHEISEISVEDPRRIAVFPAADPVPVYLGDSRFRQRFETFLSQRELYLHLKEKYGLIEYVDVTYDNRIIFHTPAEAVVG